MREGVSRPVRSPSFSRAVRLKAVLQTQRAVGKSPTSVTRPGGSLLAGGAAAPADGFGPAAFAAATLPSSSGRGSRLSGEVPIGFAPAAAADRNSGGEPTGLEPRSETPRKTVPLSEEEGGPLTPGPAGTPGGEDAAAGEAGGGEAAVRRDRRRRTRRWRKRRRRHPARIRRPRCDARRRNGLSRRCGGRSCRWSRRARRLPPGRRRRRQRIGWISRPASRLARPRRRNSRPTYQKWVGVRGLTGARTARD